MYGNSKVTKKTDTVNNLSKYTLISEGVLWRQSLKERAELEAVKEAAEFQLENDKQQENQGHVERRVMKHITESQMPKLINRYYEEGREIVFKDIMFEMYKGALWLDAEFVVEKEDVLREALSAYIDKNGGFSMLESSIKENGSVLLKSIRDLTLKVVGESTTRKTKEMKNGERDDLSFKLTPDEKEKLDLGKENIDLSTVASEVKKTVLTVIKDETSRQQKQAELLEDLEAEAEQIGTDTKPTGTKIEESTLFNSIQRSVYKQYITENLAIAADSSDSADDYLDTNDVNVNATDEDQADGINIDTEEDSMDEPDLLDDDPIDVDMDVILAETVAQYTMMELCDTIQLESLTREDIRKMSRDLLN